MSSLDVNLITSINNATIQLNRYLPLIIYLTGIIGNVLNMFVLPRIAFRGSPCALLLLLSSTASLVAIISGLTTRLTAGWAVDLSETNRWLCKIRILVLFVSRTMIVWLLVCAAIERWFLSSPRVQRRNLSTFKNALRSIAVVTIFSLSLNFALVYCYEADLIGTPARCFGYSVQCRLYTDLSFTLGTIVVPSMLMALFGLLTINSIRQIRRCVSIRDVSVSHKNHTSATQNLHGHYPNKTKNRSLLKMLLVQIFFLILSTAPYVIYRLYATFAPSSSSKSALQNAIEGFLFNLCTNLTYLATAMPFYIYTLCGGTMFRNELFLLGKLIYQKCKCW